MGKDFVNKQQEVIISQSQIDNYISLLISKIKEVNRPYQCVVGIKNGGLHISQPVAEALNLPHIGIRISYYDGKTKRRTPIVKKGKFNIGDYTSCLIVDDLVDGGLTMLAFEEMYGLRYQDDVAVIHWKEGSAFVPDFYVELKPKGWVVYPWERK